MASKKRKRFYESIADQAKTAEAGSLAKERAVLLLWFFRNVVGLGEIEAYDFICDGDNDKGIDGLYLEAGPGDEPDTLVIYQSKYTEGPDGKVGDTDIDRLVGAASHFKNSESLEGLLTARLEPPLRTLIETLGLQAVLKEVDLPVRVAIVTSGLLDADAKRKVSSVRADRDEDFIEVWDLDRLGPLAEAVKSPERLKTTISIDVTKREYLVTGTAPQRVAIVPVRAESIAAWPGIDDRWLFALNVRHQLASNKVSRGLDRAIQTPSDHPDFLAYHNGLTVICDEFTESKKTISIKNPSVVNGAQSVLAFERGLRQGHLTSDLRVAVKIVEVEGRPSLEREVSRRSNTQSGVNPRNLMANSGPQLNLTRQFEEIDGVSYETRPDVLGTGDDRVIKNDEAAQLLCAIYNRWPWLAVKKSTLFQSEYHPHIFHPGITAHHVLLADEIKLAAQRQKADFPDEYRKRSWLLTRLVACYLVGEIAREAGKNGVSVLDDPKGAVESSELGDKLDEWANIAAVTLAERHDRLGEADPFKTDFKNREKLKDLGAEAKKSYRLARRFAKGS